MKGVAQIAVAAAIILAAAACAEPTAAPAAQLDAREARRMNAPAIDSIAIISSLRDVVTSGAGNCSNQPPSGCPTLMYGDWLEAFSGGAFVGYVKGTWSSSNTAVATINNKGVATVRGVGTTIITGTYDHGRLSTSTSLTGT